MPDRISPWLSIPRRTEPGPGSPFLTASGICKLHVYNIPSIWRVQIIFLWYSSTMASTDKTGFDRVLAVINKTSLAKRLGISRQAVTNWGDSVPEAYAVRVSVISGIPVEEILPATVARLRQELKD